METLLISETSVTIYQSTRRKVPQNMNLHPRICMLRWEEKYLQVNVYCSNSGLMNEQKCSDFQKRCVGHKMCTPFASAASIRKFYRSDKHVATYARDAFGKACRSSCKVFLIRSRCLTKTDIYHGNCSRN